MEKPPTMNKNSENFINSVTIRLKKNAQERAIGSGVLVFQKHFQNKVYVITAAHNLYEKKNYKDLLPTVCIEVLNTKTKSYLTIENIPINEDLVGKKDEQDIGIIVLDKKFLQEQLLFIPEVKIIKERENIDSFIVKGFPNATLGEEQATIYPLWNQSMPDSLRFQLTLREDYNFWAVQGFSGSGIFLTINDIPYLYGIFTRYREPEKGKVIYAQYISYINRILDANYLPLVKYSYIADLGLTQEYFEKHLSKGIQNLGPRFNEGLNFKMSISNLFEDITRGRIFQRRFYNVIDSFLMQRSDGGRKDDIILGHVARQHGELIGEIKSWVIDIDLSIENKIDINWINDKIDKIDDQTRLIRRKIHEKKWEAEKKVKGENHISIQRSEYDDQLGWIRDVDKANFRFKEEIEEQLNIEVCNNPFLLIKGVAGSGKSHLLGDIANRRLKEGMPSVLLLGQLFKASKSVESNIVEILELDCSFGELLESLNSIGKQLNNRVLILIDAINEGAGAPLWKDSILGLRESISKFPYLGMVVTVRTTYFDSIFPNVNVIENLFQVTTHDGFSGNEYEALKLFCDYYNLELSHFPILAPEFTNPLFLTLICEGLKSANEKAFPKGFQGIEKIFDLYIKALNKRLIQKSDKYQLKPQIVSDAIDTFSSMCLKSKERELNLGQVVEAFDSNFPKLDNLLLDLIQEGVFTRNLRWNYKTSSQDEVIHFSYDRLGDVSTARKLIKKYSTKAELLHACEKENEIGKLVDDYIYPFSGMFEAFAILFPEKFDVELFEAFRWVFEEEAEEDQHFRNKSDRFNSFLLEGFKWRKPESININKIISWLKSDYSHIDYDRWLIALCEVSTVVDHPLNAIRLHGILKKNSMPERDSFWLQHVMWYHNYDDHNKAFPIRRLIDWAKKEGISKHIEKDTVNLAGLTLGWLLTSTKKKLRDEVTKALVNLYQNQIVALIDLLKKFKKVDDLYIQERLYAVAYGCALRCGDKSELKKLARFVFNTIFKNEKVIPHILLRDYARGVIEFAKFKGVSGNIDMKKVRPPYKSSAPVFPDKEQVDKFKSEKSSNRNIMDRVHFNLMSWDFGEKTVEYAFSNFYPISYTAEPKYKLFLNKLSESQNDIIMIISNTIQRIKSFESKKRQSFSDKGVQETLGEKIKKLKTYLNEGYGYLEDEFEEEDVKYVKNQIIPYLNDLERLKSGDYYKLFDSKGARRWMVKRVKELGLDDELHKVYEDRYGQHYGYENEIEGISQKYQWIAFHEVLALIADNYKFKDEYGRDAKYGFFRGPWQINARDIDPVYIKSNPEDELSKDEPIVDEVSNEWWADESYSYWNEPNESWVLNLNDLPDVSQVIFKQDDNEQEWLGLYKFVQWNEPKKLGEDQYSSYRKQIWYRLDSFLVKKSQKKRLLNFLKDKSFWGNWMPQHHEDNSEVFNREKFWAPAYKEEEYLSDWEQIFYKHKGVGIKVAVCTIDAKGSLSEDKSGANMRYIMPCPTIFQGLNLDYSDRDGELVDENSATVVTNVNRRGAMIRKDSLLRFLEENKLDIVWTVLAEKMSYQSGPSDNFYSTPSGYYYLDEEGNIKGEMNLYERE